MSKLFAIWRIHFRVWVGGLIPTVFEDILSTYGRPILTSFNRQYWADYPDLFADVAKPNIEIDRAVNVLRWFVSTLYGSFASRKDKEKIEKKPFNPILGKVNFTLIEYLLSMAPCKFFFVIKVKTIDLLYLPIR